MTWSIFVPVTEPYRGISFYSIVSILVHGFTDVPHFADFADPILYKDRLVMPKLIINSLNDYFWSPDHSYYYLDQLPGVNYLRLLPNAEHSTAGSGISTKHYFLRGVLIRYRCRVPTGNFSVNYSKN